MRLSITLSCVLLASCLSTEYEPLHNPQYAKMIDKSELETMVNQVDAEIQKNQPKDYEGNQGNEVAIVNPSAVEFEEADLTMVENQQEAASDDQPTVTTQKEVEEAFSPLASNRQSPHNIPIVVNQMVEKWIEYFTVKDRERFQRFLDRGEKYKKVIFNTLEENDIPKDMYYLAMIESGFVVKARSHASAAGVWQFMAATGKRYDLDYNDYVDERLDPLRATEAAAFYLRELYTVYQSWYLAMAAYNSGENRVLRAIMRTGSRDFWTLVEKKALPRETMNYVPKFLAAAIIGHNPEQFGFKINPNHELDDLKLVEVPGSVKLSHIAKVTGISHEKLKDNNPHIRRGMTPPTKSSYEIWVPKEKEQIVASAYNSLKAYRVAENRSINKEGSSSFHRVRSGETLGRIASKYGTSIANLKRWNNIRGSKIYVGRKLRVGYEENKSYASSSTDSHKVRRGENLAMIARKYGTTVSNIKNLNGLRSSKILVGARLKVSGTLVISSSSASSSSVTSVHKVRRGENLNLIASKYGIALTSLKKFNGLRRNTIYPGMRLKIPSDADRVYKVQRGDNLYKIAKKFGTSINEIKRNNGMKRNTVIVGQVLSIKHRG